MKSCRTPSALTLYSSSSPGRVHVTVFAPTVTAPEAGSAVFSAAATRPSAVAHRRRLPPSASVDWRVSPSRVTVPESF